MKRNSEEARLIEALQQMPVLDAHEHLVPEQRRVSRKVDFFILFSHYTAADFEAAGLPREDYLRLRDDARMSPEKKWKVFSRFYPLIRHGSYSRPARIWLQDMLQCGDITEHNYKDVSARLQEMNKPGLYRKVLQEKCRIQSALIAPNGAFRLQSREYDYSEYDMRLLRPLWHAISYTGADYLRQFLKGHAKADLDSYLDWMEEDFRRYQAMGVFGIKAMCQPLAPPDPKEASRVLRKLRQRRGRDIALLPAERNALASVIYDRVFRLARQHHLTVAVHSGVWGDFRDSQPTHLIPVAMNYRDVSFDLFHLGVPYVREAAMIGKMFPNVSLNLCWNTIVSPEQTYRMLDECLDMVPVNRLIVFGGDYGITVEKVYGHLKMAREVVARVLAKRIAQEEMNFAEAVQIARLWFHDNAVKIYGLQKVRRGRN